MRICSLCFPFVTKHLGPCSTKQARICVKMMHYTQNPNTVNKGDFIALKACEGLTALNRE